MPAETVSLVSAARFRNAAEGAAPATPSGLGKAAQEFEAMLLSSLLESVSKGLGDSEGQDAGHSTLSSVATHALAGVMTARGGIGIARLMLQKLGYQDAESV